MTSQFEKTSATPKTGVPNFGPIDLLSYNFRMNLFSITLP